MKILGLEISRAKIPAPAEKKEPVIAVPKKEDLIRSIPEGRISRPTFIPGTTFTDLRSQLAFVKPSYIASIIPVIRKLSWINPDVGLAVNDMVQLTNTGHKIKFDPGVPPEQIDAMRQHLEDKQKFWGDGVDGMNGIINKLIAQIWISGALSNEWVVNNEKTGIGTIALVNPETISFRWDKKKLRFLPYQQQNFETGGGLEEKYVKLNPNTYRYMALNGDTDLPHGIPPFLTALDAISTQGDMDKNIRYIIKQLGLLGFFETLISKPSMNDGENEAQYSARLTNLLKEAKTNVSDGLTDGVVVGYKDDHEFNFNSTSKDLNGVSEIYNRNEISIANGLKIAPEFLGIGSSGSETGITIIFTKMLSQLQNVQMIVAANLKFGYTLELMLAGFKFKNLRVEFNPSTITDELKYQQSQEYKIRNVNNKYKMGLISQQQAADELGYDKPDQSEPRAPIDNSGQQQEKRQDQNDKSDKKSREKSKPQPKRGDHKSNTDED